MTFLRFFVNIDHVATVRQARRADEPDPVRAAVLAELGGADGLTLHVREDRRHVQDRDLRLLMETARTPVNLELAAPVEAVLEMACTLKPAQATLVPERREEVTTEGGLDLAEEERRRPVAAAVQRLRDAGVRTSLFVDPDPASLEAAAALAVDAVELHTGEYANARPGPGAARELDRLRRAAELARSLDLAVHAGHGLTYENVRPVAAIPEIEELNIGHSVVSRAVLVGMERAVREMAGVLRRARRGAR